MRFFAVLESALSTSAGDTIVMHSLRQAAQYSLLPVLEISEIHTPSVTDAQSTISKQAIQLALHVVVWDLERFEGEMKAHNQS